MLKKILKPPTYHGACKISVFSDQGKITFCPVYLEFYCYICILYLYLDYNFYMLKYTTWVIPKIDSQRSIIKKT